MKTGSETGWSPAVNVVGLPQQYCWPCLQVTVAVETSPHTATQS